MSVARMEGLQPKASSGPLTPSAGASKPLQLHSQRPSGLPTPLKRRASAIPAPTPGSQSRNSRPPRTQAASDSDCPPRTCPSPAPLDSNRAVPVDVQPFCLEEEPPAEPSQSESPEGKEPSRRGQSEPSEDLVRPESAKREVLLLDLPAPMPPTHEKLLIDLRNTPDWIRNGTKNCTAMQVQTTSR
ncbi:proline-rich receptor-like protein kinase PERK10 [Hippocampus comes]|uniref:proline-rich receptor-like protein kinase PERK10 n=1 Tax=Hippocampus comes TaxID=109280 RepID=UPI00094E616B|nr:PREDICTED: proline-rich receptor-like protein kinase PERK10 [Hippocampus comes]